MPPIEFKKDPYLLIFYVVATICATALLITKITTLREVGVFFSSSALLPALIGRKNESTLNTSKSGK